MFSRIIECDKPQSTTKGGTQPILENFVQLRGSFLGEIKRSFGTNILKKAKLLVTKNFGLFLLVLSSVTNLRQQFIRIHKVFSQLFWNLKTLSLGRRMSTKNCSKEGYFSRKKFFFILQGRPDLNEQSITVVKEFQQLLCKL